MAMPAYPTGWTVDMVRALPDDGNRYEVIDGELFVTPAPSLVHQRAVIELLDIVRPYAKAHGVGEALVSPADVVVFVRANPCSPISSSCRWSTARECRRGPTSAACCSRSR